MIPNVIVDPESNIPGLVVLPTVIGGIESITLVGSSHLGKLVLSGAHTIGTLWTILTLIRKRLGLVSINPDSKKSPKSTVLFWILKFLDVT